MNKSSLIKLVSLRTGETQKVTQATLNAALEIIIEEMNAGNAVSLLGFGTFYVGSRQARNISNPRTGKIVRFPKALVPRFIPGRPLKKAVKGLGGKKDF